VLVWRYGGKDERGQLQFRRSLGHEWEMGVLMCAAIILERERQRRDRNGSFAAGMTR